MNADFLIPVIIVLNLTYLYFWLIVIHARRNGHIDTSAVSNNEIKSLLTTAKQKKRPYRFVIQITTKGGSVDVVRRGIQNALEGVAKYPVLQSIVDIEIVTESSEDELILAREFNDAIVPVTVFILPDDYETPLKTKLKARALHYMVEQHRKNPRDAYIVHYDEESVLTPDNLARLCRNLLRKPIGISEGSISYPLEWMESHPICRTMESNRPFGCHECYAVMTNPAPLHLHGSNLVIQERIENRIGWDIGQFRDKHPLIAEDLVFGLMVYIRYGRKVFGWHGVEMLEQPPFTLKAAHKQRERWIMGALQGVNHVATLPGWKKVPLFERLKIQWLIRLRIVTYVVGLPVSILSLLTWVGISAMTFLWWCITGEFSLPLTLLALPGLAMWIGGTQLGLAQNIRFAKLTRWEKLVEHLRIMAYTPLAGIYDTAGPAVALAKWASGKRGVAWKPTPKLVGQEFGDNDLTPETVAVATR